MTKTISTPNRKKMVKTRVKNFKRIETVKYKNNFFKVFIDKNDSVFEIKKCEVISWKSIEKGTRKINVPDKVSEERDAYLFNKIKGNPFKLALVKILGELDAQELLS